MDNDSLPHDPPAAATDDRRSFATRALAGMIGALVGLVPVASGLATFFDPLRRRREKVKPVRVATLAALPDDGVPRRFAVLDERVDAWTKHPKQPIGAVYLRRQPGETTPQAFTTICPHLGCSYVYKPNLKQYACPCHTSGFSLDGEKLFGPSPRPLDSLEVELRDGDEIWVKYQQFRSGLAEKVPE